MVATSAKTFNLPAVVAGDDCYLMARVRGPDGNYLTQAGLSSINFIIWDDYELDEVASGSLPVSGTVYDELQANADDPRFPARGAGAGYNFGHLIDGGDIPDGGRSYEVIYSMVPTTGNPYRWSVKLPARKIPS